MASRKKVMLQVLDGNWGTTAYNDERWVNLKGFDTVEEAGTPKADAFVKAVRGMLAVMENLEAERVARLGAEE